MKFSQVLYHQHIGRMVKRHWLTSSRKILNNDEIELAVKQLEMLNADIVDANEVFLEKNDRTKEKLKIYAQNNRQVYLYNTDSLLIEGVKQAQVLTNTIVLNSLPSKYMKFLDTLKIPGAVHEDVKRNILTAHLFDAEQKKIEKIYDPLRPAFNFPRVYGITEERRNMLIIDKLLRHSERLTKNTANNLEKKILNNSTVKVAFEKDGNEIRMDLLTNLLISSTKPIESVAEFLQKDHETLPDLFPLKSSSSLKFEFNKEWEDLYPINLGNIFVHPHTVLTTYTSNTKTLHEFPANESQNKSRNLLYAFAIASSRAKQQFGRDVKKLPHPVVVQAIYTNGRSYHFGVFQLNTLDLNAKEGQKNVWHDTEIEDLYVNCLYLDGKPQLVNYNPAILAKFFTFYNQ